MTAVLPPLDLAAFLDVYREHVSVVLADQITVDDLVLSLTMATTEDEFFQTAATYAAAIRHGDIPAGSIDNLVDVPGDGRMTLGDYFTRRRLGIGIAEEALSVWISDAEFYEQQRGRRIEDLEDRRAEDRRYGR